MDENLRVLEVVQSLERGGRSVRFITTVEGLRENGAFVLPVSFRAPKFETCQPKSLVVLHSKVFDGPCILYNLVRLIRKHQINLIHCHCDRSMIWAGIAAKICRLPTVLTFHRSILSYYQKNRVNRLLMRLTNRFVAVSEQRRRLLIDNLGLTEQRCIANHGGIDTQAEVVGKTEAREQLKLPNQQVVLFSAGHLGRIKGHQDTIKAFKQISDQYDCQLYIAGSGSNKETKVLKRYRDKLHLQDQVHFLGQISNASLWMDAADIFVQPSREEAFGLVFIEAGLHHTPVVATNVGGIPDIIISGETGYLVPVASPDALVEALRSLIESSQLREQFGAAAEQRIKSNFDKQNMIDKYLTTFNQLLTEA
ncbi:glycosyltransferase family 4 protein [Agarivorans sp. MS3-6]